MMFPFNAEAFNRWCISEGLSPDRIKLLSTILGSKVSELFKSTFRNIPELSPIAITPHEQGLFKAVEKFLLEYDLLECEKTVYNHDYRYAGTLDGIIQHKKTGKIYIADWKTFGAWKPLKGMVYKKDSKKIKKASIQIDMYAEALDKKELDRAVIVFIPTGEYDFNPVEPIDVWKKWIEENKEKLEV